MDGRYPTETDYDYKSEMIGTDFVRIQNSDTIFNSGAWNPQVAGMLVVVGIIAKNNNVTYSLTMRDSSSTTQLNQTDIESNIIQSF